MAKRAKKKAAALKADLKRPKRTKQKMVPGVYVPYSGGGTYESIYINSERAIRNAISEDEERGRRGPSKKRRKFPVRDLGGFDRDEMFEVREAVAGARRVSRPNQRAAV